MSVLEYFLGPRPHMPELTAADMQQPRTLELPEGVLVHLQECENAENIVIFSQPGALSEAHWLDGETRPWRSELPHPGFPGVRSLLTVEPGSYLIRLVDVVERGALDKTLFSPLLEDHAGRHRYWRSLIEAAEESEDEEEEDDDFDDEMDNDSEGEIKQFP
jgi:hypothetical protein